jgi:hypothetical protein
MVDQGNVVPFGKYKGLADLSAPAGEKENQMSATVTVTSSLHGERVFRRVGYEPHRRVDGSETVLAVWEGTCVICGAPFKIRTSSGAKRGKAFDVRTCEQHRLTPAETMRLRFAKPADRHVVFESIKAAKQTVQ